MIVVQQQVIIWEAFFSMAIALPGHLLLIR